jgi:UDP-GlcNAc:undecaprenyl-phosphate/decaprenyl-phosphate GlcNAc-1-phosphate transferase
VSAYLWVFLTAAAVTFAATPLVRRAVVALGAIDHPSDRKVHPRATPTMGGIAMYGGFLAALAVSRFLPFFDEMHQASPEPLAAVVTCTLMVGLGIIDDARGTTALSKLAAQVFIAGVLVLLGVQFAYFVVPWQGGAAQVVSLSPDIAVILTIAWAVAVANAVNLLDGLDGLAAGMMAIAATAFFIYMVRSPSLFGEASQAALLSIVTAGICVGFLPWNFHPARIFMGDSGSMLLGMVFSIATVSGVGRNPYPPAPGDLAAILGAAAVPLLVLFIPFLDVVLAVIRRTRRGQGIGHADKEHLHHRLMDIGHGHRRAVLLMYLWSALLSGAGLAIGLIDGRFVVTVILLGALALFLVTALPPLAQRRRNGTEEEDGAAAAEVGAAPGRAGDVGP